MSSQLYKIGPSAVRVIVSALKAQKKRLETDKAAPEFIGAPINFVVAMNDEIKALTDLIEVLES